MPPEPLTAILTELLAAERTHELDFIRRFPLAGAGPSPSPDHWSLKDTLAHAAAWKERTAARILDWQRGIQSANQEDLDEINRVLYEACKNYSQPELEQALAAGHESMLQAAGNAETLRLRVWNERPVWAVVVSIGIWHPLYHLSGWQFAAGQRLEALSLLEDFRLRLQALPAEPHVHGLAAYDCAVLQLNAGNREQAVARLSDAFAFSAVLKEWARQDSDLASLWGNAVFD